MRRGWLLPKQQQKGGSTAPSARSTPPASLNSLSHSSSPATVPTPQQGSEHTGAPPPSPRTGRAQRPLGRRNERFSALCWVVGGRRSLEGGRGCRCLGRARGTSLRWRVGRRRTRGIRDGSACKAVRRGCRDHLFGSWEGRGQRFCFQRRESVWTNQGRTLTCARDAGGGGRARNSPSVGRCRWRGGEGTYSPAGLASAVGPLWLDFGSHSGLCVGGGLHLSLVDAKEEEAAGGRWGGRGTRLSLRDKEIESQRW